MPSSPPASGAGTLESRFIQLGPYLLTGFILIAANFVAYHRPEFWAEDGCDFFADAFNLGPRSVLLFLGGYLNLIPRMVAFAGTALPVRWIPAFYVWSAWLASAFTLGYLARDSFAWLIPGRGARIALACLFAIAPGSLEITQAICNIHTVLVMLFALLLLEETPRWGIARLAAFVAIAFSSPELPALVPLLIIVAFARRQRRFLFPLSVILGAFCFNLFGMTGEHGGYALTTTRLWLIPKVIVERIFLYSIVLPILGPHAGERFFHLSPVVFWGAAFLILSIAGWLIAQAARRMTPIDGRCLWFAFGFWLAGAVTFGMLTVTRPYLWTLVQRDTGSAFWESRYAFLPVTFSFLAWAILAVRARWGRELGWLIVALFCLQILRFPAKAGPRPNVHWPKSAGEIEALLESRRKGELTVPQKVSNIGLQPNAYLRIAIWVVPKSG